MPGRITLPAAYIAVFFLLIFQAACSQSPNKPLEDVLKSFTGKWKVVSLDRNGTSSDPKAVMDMEVTLEGDKFRFVEMRGPSRGEGEVTARDTSAEEYVFQVNPAKNGDIDFIHASGENTGKSRSGLYEIEGDTLKICVSSVGAARPTRIAGGPGITLFVLERQP